MAHRYQFQIGDLVKCIYDLFEYYEYFWDDDPYDGYPFYGIVLEIQEGIQYEEQYGYDKLYIVQCFDGHVRFFTSWEMKLVSTSS